MGVVGAVNLCSEVLDRGCNWIYICSNATQNARYLEADGMEAAVAYDTALG